MRILFLSQLVPYPLDAGPKVRSYYVLRHLAAAGHEITLLAFSRENDTAASIVHLRSFCAAVHTVPMARSRVRDAFHFGRSLLGGLPFLIARDSVAAMHGAVRDIASSKPFDVIHADQLWMASYALVAAAGAADARPRLVLDQHNAMYRIPQRLAESSDNSLRRAILRREAKVMRRYEVDTCRRFDEVVWVTTEDRAAVGLDEPTDSLQPSPQQYVIPICVDPDAQPVIRRVPSPFRVTFLGGLHWPPNAAGILWFAREVWPRVAAECPHAVLTVIGKNPPSELAGDRRPAAGGVEVTGYVADPMLYLAETAVFIVPLHAGGGMRVKILDAWAWGLPVVSTTIGAEGIACRDGGNLLIADEAAALAAAVVRVCREMETGRALGNAGRSAVEAGYDWHSAYTAWDTIYAPARGCMAEESIRDVERDFHE